MLQSPQVVINGKAVTEFNLIYHHINTQSIDRADVLTGIGDDCAILNVPDGYSLAVTMDTLVSGVHFPDNASAYSIGYKALAVNLSDLASAGATPAWITLSLTMPCADTAWLDDFLQGLYTLAKKFDVQLIGGDTTTGPLSISIQAHGFVKKALLRSNAKVNDLIFVSGFLGDAAQGFKSYKEYSTINENCKSRFDTPEPRIELGIKLAGIANSCIDISDGLVSDLGHICKKSHCGAEIYLPKIPLSDAYISSCSKDDLYTEALTFGDDYELCFTVSPDMVNDVSVLSENLGLPLTCIGKITNSESIHFLDKDNNIILFNKKGYEHFK